MLVFFHFFGAKVQSKGTNELREKALCGYRYPVTFRKRFDNDFQILFLKAEKTEFQEPLVHTPLPVETLNFSSQFIIKFNYKTQC